ncbi:hypothetical protein ACFLTL_02715 [Chloroflexota bacterium]
MLTLPVIFTLLIIFVATGCSATDDASPSPSETAALSPTPAPEYFEPSGNRIPDGTEDWWEAAHEEGRVAGTVYTIIDGKRIEVTVGSVIAQATKNEDGTWYWPPFVTFFCGNSDEYAWGHISTRINEETGEIYVAVIEWISAEEFQASQEARGD